MTTVPDPTLALTDPDAEGIDGLGDAVQPGDAVRDPSDDGDSLEPGDAVRDPRGEGDPLEPGDAVRDPRGEGDPLEPGDAVGEPSDDGDTVRVIPLADAPGVSLITAVADPILALTAGEPDPIDGLADALEPGEPVREARAEEVGVEGRVGLYVAILPVGGGDADATLAEPDADPVDEAVVPVDDTEGVALAERLPLTLYEAIDTVTVEEILTVRTGLRVNPVTDGETESE